MKCAHCGCETLKKHETELNLESFLPHARFPSLTRYSCKGCGKNTFVITNEIANFRTLK